MDLDIIQTISPLQFKKAWLLIDFRYNIECSNWQYWAVYISVTQEDLCIPHSLKNSAKYESTTTYYLEISPLSFEQISCFNLQPCRSSMHSMSSSSSEGLSVMWRYDSKSGWWTLSISTNLGFLCALVTLWPSAVCNHV